MAWAHPRGCSRRTHLYHGDTVIAAAAAAPRQGVIVFGWLRLLKGGLRLFILCGRLRGIRRFDLFAIFLGTPGQQGPTPQAKPGARTLRIVGFQPTPPSACSQTSTPIRLRIFRIILGFWRGIRRSNRIFFFSQRIAPDGSDLIYRPSFYIIEPENTSTVIYPMSAPQAPSDGLRLPDLQPTRARRFASTRTITALILREMSTSYGRSPGGYLWAILEPVGGIAILSVAFALIMRHPPLGTNFILFYATGFLPFTLFQDISQNVARCINYSRPLLQYPSVTWVDTLLARLILQCLTGLMIGSLVLGGILLIFETGAVINVGPIFMSVLMAALFGLGVGAVNCTLTGLYPIWSLIWSVITRPLFIASGVLLLLEDLPRWVRDILWYNPLIHITGEMRRGFYPMYAADYVSLPYVFCISLALTALGLVLLGRYHLEILNRE